MSTITLRPGGQQVECGVDEPVLIALERAGYPVPSDCRAEARGTCKVIVLDGGEAMERATRRNRDLCCAWPADLGWPRSRLSRTPR